MKAVAWITALGVLSAGAGLPSELPPPGPHIRLAPEVHTTCPTFRTGQPIVGTTYFYWYDVYSGQHMTMPDGRSAFSTRPPADVMADLSYRSLAWHEGQLRDMIRAGVDFLLPVYGGEPGQYDHWTVIGLQKLVEAHQRLGMRLGGRDMQRMPPAVGMFYDTTTLQDNRLGVRVDLTTAEGRGWFYGTIRDFWSILPPRLWARIDGRPIIFLYLAGFASGIDAALFDDARRRFQADFGTDFFLIRHDDWPGEADGWYRWGGALGLELGDPVAALGPGYDDRQVRRPGSFVDRRRGEFYDRQWIQLLRIHPDLRPWIVHLETWNEWHEGTDIARSAITGDLYIRATRKFAQAFHERIRLDGDGPFAAAREVRWTPRQVDGLYLRPAGGDGCWEPTGEGEAAAVVSVPCPDLSAGRYLYFDIDDSMVFAGPGLTAEVIVTFLDDAGAAGFRIEYDGSDRRAGPGCGAFRPGPAIPLGATGQWRTVTQNLPEVMFCNRTNRADFRLAVEGRPGRLTVREVRLRRPS